VEDFLEKCISCGECQEACPFLSEYGTPNLIISENPSAVFLCTNCRACNSVCPQQLYPSEALYETKYKLIKENALPENVKNALISANSFALRGHKFPFSYYSSSDTVFWPGCSLTGTNPDIVKKTINILSKHLNKNVGLVLDCCFDPLHQIGDKDKTKKASERIKERLKKHKINYVITGCVNCKKIFSLYMPEVKAQHVLEVISNSTIYKTSLPQLKAYLHHPCPSYRFDEIRRGAKEQALKHSNDMRQTGQPSCCGLGGGLSSIDSGMSDKFADKVIKASENSDIITYCMGCKGNFLKKGKKAYHVLEFIAGVKPLEQPVSSAKKWINRLFLSMNMKLKSKKIFTAIIVIAAIILATYLRKAGYIDPEAIMSFIQKHSFAAPLLFILIYTIGPSLFIPSLPLTLWAGFLWGPFWGVVFSITGATLGASTAFLISRYIIGNTIKERFSYARWQWLKERVERHGWKAVAFSRIVPIFPFPVLNYLFGITPIPFLHYLWSTFIFMLPACIAYVAFGSSMGELILKGNVKGIVIGILIASVAILLPLALKPLARKVFPEKSE
jgi:uncharacterized membrane protein YdjX (TVP38/TMEM64 family)/Fe-S oxidoreductase